MCECTGLHDVTRSHNRRGLLRTSSASTTASTAALIGGHTTSPPPIVLTMPHALSPSVQRQRNEGCRSSQRDQDHVESCPGIAVGRPEAAVAMWQRHAVSRSRRSSASKVIETSRITLRGSSYHATHGAHTNLECASLFFLTSGLRIWPVISRMQNIIEPHYSKSFPHTGAT